MNTQYHFGTARVLLIDNDLGARESAKALLVNYGFRGLRLGVDTKLIVDTMNNEYPDLLVCEASAPPGDLCELIYQIRHGQLGKNPFLPIIATTWDPTLDLVYKLIESGADQVLCKPISTANLVSHVDLLVERRKPFTVTSEYIGPVRRQGSMGAQMGKLIEAPNSLRAKADGSHDERDMQRMIDAAVVEVNQQKLERHSEQAVTLVGDVLAVYRRGPIDASLVMQLDRLIYVAQDTDRRLRGGRYAHVSELSQSLLKVATDIKANYKSPDPKDLRLLMPLAQAIEQAFKVKEEDDIAAARSISGEIGRAKR